ncbi:GntR family transcriptional regulator [Asticcacaulis sp.]|uniref:GntR family transcriptional regulator n=1 Tax=Asticcacaulis sp. TaxID=1872648 RepID=UPI00260FCB7C|nr:GntR family transcriptional regulator [Asticcacaulis sp.]
MSVQDSVVETLYLEVKRELLSGRILPGERLNIKALCEQHRVSKSPIRNILNRLVGEGLLAAQAHDGFYRPRVTVQSLRELYNWEQDIVLLAIRDGGLPPAPPELPLEPLTEESIEGVLSLIAEGSGNTVYRAALAHVSAHLSAIRRTAPSQAFTLEPEIAGLLEALKETNPDALRRRLKRYYHRRLSKLSDIVADAYRGRSQ